ARGVRKREESRRGKLDGSDNRALIEPPIDARLAIQWSEQAGEGTDRLGAAEKQDATRAQAVVKQRDELLLQLRGQVNEQIAARQDVQLREGRIHDDVLWGKDHHLSDLFADPVATLLLNEESAQALGGDIGGDVVGIQ